MRFPSVGWQALLMMLGLSASQALAAKVTLAPANPRQGDTIVVNIALDPGETTPQVTFADKTYPAFAEGPGRWRALLPTSPLDTPGIRTLQVSGPGSAQLFQVNLNPRQFPTQRIVFSPRVASTEPTKLELERAQQFRAQVTPEKRWAGSFQRPNAGPVTSGFGVRRYYNGVFAKDYYHRGIDYAGPIGSVVVAPAPGRVGLVGLESQGFRLQGNMVGIDHGQGVTSVFLHLNRISVKEGDLVKTGQPIGTIGASGMVTGPHLHWGLFVHGISVDPIPWLNGQIE